PSRWSMVRRALSGWAQSAQPLPAGMFELLGEFFPGRRQQDKGDAGFFAASLIRQLQHASGAFAIIFRTASSRRLVVFVHRGFPIRYAIEQRTRKSLRRFTNFFPGV